MRSIAQYDSRSILSGNLLIAARPALGAAAHRRIVCVIFLSFFITLPYILISRFEKIIIKIFKLIDADMQFVDWLFCEYGVRTSKRNIDKAITGLIDMASSRHLLTSLAILSASAAQSRHSPMAAIALRSAWA